MADDYSISAKITADTSGFESGITKAQKASKNLSKSISGVIQGLGKSGLVGALGAVGLASQGVTATLGAVQKIARKVSETIDECTQAYRRQYQAEIALTTAVDNNPYVDGTATKRLKEFASEMQRVSDIGDEELLPMMADLIAKGRTEDETMQIMSVALDMSAGGAMSLDTAITQLNATLNGTVGRLGQQNAELKDLTAEELKQGKAVEILGAKYKGLAQATADSQKQLRNAIGDLKENIGQIFEQALAPMRKFFTEVITNLNNSISKSRELKSAMKEVFGDNGEINLASSTDALNTAFSEVLHKQQEVTKNYQQYIQLYGKYIDVTTDETALSYRAQISDLNAQLKTISEELDKRRRESEEEKRKLAQAKADEEAQKELEKQKEIREKELAIENEWGDKLFAIRLENLEKTRDAELENEELTYEKKLEIYDFYGSQILAMKLKQIEKEREEALNGENVTEEARANINLYYDNKITQAKQKEAENRTKIKENEVKEEEKQQKESYTNMLSMAVQNTKKMAETFKNVAKKIASTIKSIISGIGNIFSKLFAFNPDEALNNLLKFEDSVLTFFLETLPKLPKFFASAVESIINLIQSVLNYIDFNAISNIIGDIILVIGKLISSVSSFISNNADVLIKGLTDLLKTVIDGLAGWVESGGWRELLNAIMTIQKAVENAIAENLPALVDTIVNMLPDLIQFLIDSIVSASKTLSKLIKPILKLVVSLIEAVIEVAFSDDVLDASMEVIQSFIKSFIQIVIEKILPLLPKIIARVVKFIISSIPKAVTAIVKGIVQGFAKTDWGQTVKDIFTGFIDAFKDLFGIHSPSTLFESFGQFMVEGLWKGISEMGNWLKDKLTNFFSGIWNSITSTFSGMGDGIKSVFSGIGDWFSSVFNNLRNQFSNFIESIKSGMSSVGSGISDWANNFGGGVSDWFEDVGEGISDWFDSWKWWATGTNVAPSGLAVVGEAGPELVRFNGGEQVLNTRNTQKALEGIGKNNGNTFNVTFNNLQDTSAFAMMQQLKQYNRQMAINGVL